MAKDSENQWKVSAKQANLSNTAASGPCSVPDHLHTLDRAGGTGDIQAPGLQFRKLLRVIRSYLNLGIYRAAKPSLHATLSPSLSFSEIIHPEITVSPGHVSSSLKT